MSRPLTLAALLALLPVSVAVMPLAAQAEEVAAATIGPEIGAAAPFGSLVDSAGAPADMAALAGPHGTVVAFVRSADWCPFCKKQLVDLETAKAPLAELGWSLVSVSYDPPETLAAFAAGNEVTYPMLSDEGSQTITAFGLLNTTIEKGTRAYGVPHPALVFVNSDGSVDAVLREESYRDRPAIDTLIETAARLTREG